MKCFSILLSLGILAIPRLFAKEPAKVVILKLDDFSSRTEVPTENWQRVVDYIHEHNLTASFGMIGRDIKRATPAFCEWIRGQQESGRIEFWNHGLTHQRVEKDGKKVAEFQEPFAAQVDTLEQTQRLGEEKLGIVFTAFGAPFNAINADTAKALEAVGIKVWLYGYGSAAREGGYTGVLLKRSVNLEKTTSVPDFNFFKKQYLEKNPQSPLVLQGHPHGWSEERFAEFVKIVAFLSEEGYVFMKPSEYAAGK
ncbi:polysaccharide deacetylase family protein [Kiritimatiellaeota bacterium B1221]|nr:polysaccharide deacetylase family protein [Kiritimatiellaeota bacterium B1221]